MQVDVEACVILTTVLFAKLRYDIRHAHVSEAPWVGLGLLDDLLQKMRQAGFLCVTLLAVLGAGTMDLE